MKNKFLSLLFLCLLICPGCASKTSDTAPELLEPLETEHVTVPVTCDSFSDTEVYEGFVAPETTELSFDLDGNIRDILVSSGSYVNKGDALVSLDTTETEEKIYMLNNREEDLRAELAYTEALYENRAAYLNAEANQIIENEWYSSNYQLKQIEMRENELNYDQKIRELKQQLSANSRALTEQKALLSKAVLHAPHSGYFYLSPDLIENTYLQRGKTVCRIACEDSFSFMSSYVDEADLKNAQLSVLIQGNFYPVSYVPLSEKERSALYFADEYTRTCFSFSDDSDLSALQAGDTGFLLVDGNCLTQALQVPVNALLHDSSGTYVYLSENGTQRRQDVTTGPTNGVMTVIEAGVSEGDLVYVQ